MSPALSTCPSPCALSEMRCSAGQQVWARLWHQLCKPCHCELTVSLPVPASPELTLLLWQPVLGDFGENSGGRDGVWRDCSLVITEHQSAPLQSQSQPVVPVPRPEHMGGREGWAWAEVPKTLMHPYFSLIFSPLNWYLSFLIGRRWPPLNQSCLFMDLWALEGDRGQGFGHLGGDLQADGPCLHPRAKVGHSPVRRGQEGPWESQLLEETLEQASALLSSLGW